MLPDVQRGPVGDREDANALALVLPGVVELPQLRPLVLRVPAMVGRAKGEDALLGAALLLVAPSAAERRVETIFVKRLLQPFRLHPVGVQRAMIEGVDPARSEERRVGEEWGRTGKN